MNGQRNLAGPTKAEVDQEAALLAPIATSVENLATLPETAKREEEVVKKVAADLVDAVPAHVLAPTHVHDHARVEIAKKVGLAPALPGDPLPLPRKRPVEGHPASPVQGVQAEGKDRSAKSTLIIKYQIGRAHV